MRECRETGRMSGVVVFEPVTVACATACVLFGICFLEAYSEDDEAGAWVHYTVPSGVIPEL